MTINAIQTRFAGCHFRSRLEARWAVFFNHFGIPWEYEPQGFEATWRLSLTEGTFRYLPDFWLPDQRVWVEVKGSLTQDEYIELLNAAAALSSNNGGGCHDSGGHDVVVLGPVPDPTRSPRIPIRLHMHKGDLIASCWLCGEPHSGPVLGDDSGTFLGRVREGIGMFHAPEYLLGGRACPLHHGSTYGPALTAARSARFEYGEQGG